MVASATQRWAYPCRMKTHTAVVAASGVAEKVRPARVLPAWAAGVSGPTLSTSQVWARRATAPASCRPQVNQSIHFIRSFMIIVIFITLNKHIETFKMNILLVFIIFLKNYDAFKVLCVCIKIEI